MSDKNNFMEEPSEEMTVTLTLDDGSQLECVILTIFEAGGRDYIALLPMDGEDADEGEVYLYRYTEIDGNPDLQTSRTTRSTRLWQMPLMSFWTSRNTMSLWERTSWTTERDGLSETM